MTYETFSSFAQTWGLLYFVAMFAAICVYAFWPKNKAEFDRAAALPLADRGIDQED
jgi:cytochrome c oxidase cbb3-type subunit 4